MPFRKRIRNRHLKELVSGSMVSFVLKMSGMFLGYLVIMIVSKEYGVEGTGLYNLTYNLMTFFAAVAAMGMNVSILRYVGQFNQPGEEGKLKLLYRYAVELALPAAMVVAMALYAFSGVLAENLFENPLYGPALTFVACILPLVTLQNIGIEYIRGLKKLKVSEWLRSVLRPLVIIVCLLSVGYTVSDPLMPIYALGAAVAVGVVWAALYIRSRVRGLEAAPEAAFGKREFMATSLPMMLMPVSLFIRTSFPLFVLEIYGSTAEVGVLSVVWKIALLISLVLSVVNTIVAPKFSELYWSQQYQPLREVLHYSAKMIFLVSLGVSVLLVLFSRQVLEFFGADFISGEAALYLLVGGQLISAMAGSVGIFFNMVGYQGVWKNILIVSILANVALSLALIPLFGMMGAAFAIMATTVMQNLAGALYLRIKLGYRTYYVPFGRANGL